MKEESSLAVTKQYANGTGQILPLLQSRKPKKGGSPKKWQNFGKYFRFSSDFRRLKSSLNRLWHLISTRQDSNRQPCDSTIVEPASFGRRAPAMFFCRAMAQCYFLEENVGDDPT
jgi:hypothetical protein